MKLWEVTNGYTGNTYVRALVIALTDAEAIELARPKFKKDTMTDGIMGLPPRQLYDASYYENLRATLLCDDVSREWAGEVNDG